MWKMVTTNNNNNCNSIGSSTLPAHISHGRALGGPFPPWTKSKVFSSFYLGFVFFIRVAILIPLISPDKLNGAN